MARRTAVVMADAERRREAVIVVTCKADATRDIDEVCGSGVALSYFGGGARANTPRAQPLRAHESRHSSHVSSSARRASSLTTVNTPPLGPRPRAFLPPNPHSYQWYSCASTYFVYVNMTPTTPSRTHWRCL